MLTMVVAPWTGFARVEAHSGGIGPLVWGSLSTAHTLDSGARTQGGILVYRNSVKKWDTNLEKM
jgi:hypothetical protein